MKYSNLIQSQSKQRSQPVAAENPTIIQIGSAVAKVYKVAAVTEHELPLSVYGSAALFMSFAPAWWESKEHAAIVRPLVFGLAGQEQIREGLYLIPALPQSLLQSVHSEPDRYIIRVVDLNNGKR